MFKWLMRKIKMAKKKEFEEVEEVTEEVVEKTSTKVESLDPERFTR